jgi:plastocyanin
VLCCAALCWTRAGGGALHLCPLIRALRHDPLVEKEESMVVHLPRPRRLAISGACAVLCVFLGLAACGGSPATGGSPSATSTPTATPTTPPLATTPATSGAATIAMGFGVFKGTPSVTIKAGAAVTFDDSAGGPHNLVIGMHGQRMPQAGAPTQLNNAPGLSFGGGDMMSVTFTQAGIFHVTCTFHPNMQATVTVTA